MTFVHFLQARLRACDFVELQCDTDNIIDTTSYYTASETIATMAHSKSTSTLLILSQIHIH
jgi:hypothetical protein